MVEILTAKELSMAFGDQKVFSNINFSIKQGSKTAVLGANGSGKTTLIRIILGSLYPSAGWITVGDIDGRELKIGYVPQFREIDKDYPLSIRSFVELNGPIFKNSAYNKKVDAVLEKTELADIQNYRLGKASGGQKQRAYLAQALLDEPDLIILDESTASLDPVAKETLMKLLDRLNAEDELTILFTTHDIPLAKEHMNDFILFANGTATTGSMENLDQEVADVQL